MKKKLYSIVCIGAVAVGVLAFKGQKAVEQYEIPAPLKDRPEQDYARRLAKG